jgi:hypothetical protein
VKVFFVWESLQGVRQSNNNSNIRVGVSVEQCNCLDVTVGLPGCQRLKQRRAMKGVLGVRVTAGGVAKKEVGWDKNTRAAVRVESSASV